MPARLRRPRNHDIIKNTLTTTTVLGLTILSAAAETCARLPRQFVAGDMLACLRQQQDDGGKPTKTKTRRRSCSRACLVRSMFVFGCDKPYTKRNPGHRLPSASGLNQRAVAFTPPGAGPLHPRSVFTCELLAVRRSRSRLSRRSGPSGDWCKRNMHNHEAIQAPAKWRGGQYRLASSHAIALTKTRGMRGIDAGIPMHRSCGSNAAVQQWQGVQTKATSFSLNIQRQGLLRQTEQLLCLLFGGSG